MNKPCRFESEVDGSLVPGRMVLDARLGNTPKWYLGPCPEINMRVPKEVYKSTVYVGYRRADGAQKLYATGFVVSVDGWGGAQYHYLVTTRHGLVSRLASLPNFENVQEFRANSADGTARTVRHSGKWFFHPTESASVDIAACPFDIEGLDIIPIPVSNFASPEIIDDYYIGPGDEVAITGLFTRLHGESKNVPVVRRGSVAMFPDEKIPNANMGDGTTANIDGYLVEVRSVGGLSGSPVFVRAPIGIDYVVFGKKAERRQAKGHLQGDYHLLGVCHGHWEIPPDAINSLEFATATDEASINLGIAIVVPAQKILEVLEHPELESSRRDADQANMNARGATTPDGANQ